MVPRFRGLVTEGEMRVTEERTGLKFKIKSFVLDIFKIKCMFTGQRCQIRQLDICWTVGKLES